ncbi:MAG: M48 family metalloprotease [Caulobacterales bacterium]
MTPSRRSLALGGIATAALAAIPRPSQAAGDAFSVSGKKGPFVKQVASRNLDGGGAGGGAMGLASDTVNLGQYQAARLRMPQTEARVSALLANIDAQWPYAKGQPLQVHILGVDYYNAYSLPDGSIVVAFGLLDQAQSDDEVAFVLAHELGHVRLGHFKAAVAAEQKTKLASPLGQLFVIGAAGALASGAGLQAGATNDFLHFLTNTMVEPGHTRAQEDEADCIGYDLSQAASYSADSASARVFDTIQADQQRHKALSDTLGEQLKSQLGQAVTNGTAASFLSGGDVRGSLLQGAGRVALGVIMARGGEPPPQHRPPEERKRGMAQYSADAYPAGAPLRDEQKSWLAGVRGSTEYAQGKLAVEAVRDAKKARAAGDYPTATAAIARASQTTFKAAPLVLNEAARLRDDMGDAAGSDRLFVQAHASPDQTVDGYVDHGRMLYRTKQNDRAMLIVQQGIQRFNNDPKPFIALEIGIARQAGRDDQAQGYLAQCMSYNDEGLSKDCQLAAGPLAKGAAPQQKRPSLPFGLPHFP